MGAGKVVRGLGIFFIADLFVRFIMRFSAAVRQIPLDEGGEGGMSRQSSGPPSVGL
jgi:hypothetical protein